MRLNIGSGEHRAAGWVNVDVWPDTKPDKVADVRDLPFADNSAQSIYCGHVLEHVPFQDIPRTCAELRRVLAQDGQLCVVGPDCDRVLTDPEWESLIDSCEHGAGRYPSDHHLWRSTGKVMLRELLPFFPDAVEIPVADVDRDVWPLVDDPGWQFAIVA